MNVIYFSGNGNTKHCSELFSKLTGNGKISSIEEENVIQVIKDSPEFAFAYPVHYSNIPFIVKDFIKNNALMFSGKKIFLIATMGAFSGDGTGCAARMLKKCGAKITGGLHLQMPDAIGDVGMLKKSHEKNLAIISNSEEKISYTCNLIKNGKYPQQGLHFYNQIAGLFGQRLWFLQAAKNHRKDLRVAPAKCNGCGLCQKQCPTKSIQIVDGKAKLVGKNCTICYRCVNSCPNKAITIIGKKIIEQCLFKNYQKV